jgi:hypothetical protein
MAWFLHFALGSLRPRVRFPGTSQAAFHQQPAQKNVLSSPANGDLKSATTASLGRTCPHSVRTGVSASRLATNQRTRALTSALGSTIPFKLQPTTRACAA